MSVTTGSKIFIKPKKKQVEDSLIGLISNILNKEITFGSHGLSNRYKLEIYRNLNILGTSGIDLITSLELAIQGANNKKVKQVLESIKANVINGFTVSSAFEVSGLFTPFELAGIKIGEETGRLSQIFGELTKYYTTRNDSRRKIIGMLTYPLTIILTAVLAVAFMLGFVVPMFQDVFSRFGKELPMLTNIVIKVSGWFAAYAFWVLGVLLTGFIWLFINRKKQWFRQLSSQIILKVPYVGDLVAKTYLARFCMAMELLLSSHTPLLQAISLSGNMVGFYPIQNALPVVIENIMAGISLHQALGKHKVFDGKIIAMLRVGEEVNKLAEMFGTIKSQYSIDVAYKMGVLGNIIEPLIIVLVGALVAIILIAMYLPVFQMGSAIG